VGASAPHDTSRRPGDCATLRATESLGAPKLRSSPNRGVVTPQRRAALRPAHEIDDQDYEQDDHEDSDQSIACPGNSEGQTCLLFSLPESA
jgi:hypothetical protein